MLFLGLHLYRIIEADMVWPWRIGISRLFSVITCQLLTLDKPLQIDPQLQINTPWYRIMDGKVSRATGFNREWYQGITMLKLTLILAAHSILMILWC